MEVAVVVAAAANGLESALKNDDGCS